MNSAGRFGALVVATTLAFSGVSLAGCSSSSTSSGDSASASASTTGLTAEQRNYCTTVTKWGTSTAAADLKAANATGDRAAVQAALKAYLVETKAMVESVPADAPADVKDAYQAVLTGVQASAAGSITKAQQEAQTAARPTITAYYAEICN